jgi:hypothetical protein
MTTLDIVRTAGNARKSRGLKKRSARSLVLPRNETRNVVVNGRTEEGHDPGLTPGDIARNEAAPESTAAGTPGRGAVILAIVGEAVAEAAGTRGNARRRRTILKDSLLLKDAL